MKIRFLALLPLALLAQLHPLLAWAQQTPAPATPPPQYYMPYWSGPGHMWGNGGGFWWGGPLMMLGFVAVVVLVFLLIRRSGDGYHHHRCHHCGRWNASYRAPGPDQAWDDPTNSALQILNERFARGEIQQQEYDEKKAALLSGKPR